MRFLQQSQNGCESGHPFPVLLRFWLFSGSLKSEVCQDSKDAPPIRQLAKLGNREGMPQTARGTLIIANRHGRRVAARRLVHGDRDGGRVAAVGAVGQVVCEGIGSGESDVWAVEPTQKLAEGLV